jgi:hypothetical protein
MRHTLTEHWYVNDAPPLAVRQVTQLQALVAGDVMPVRNAPASTFFTTVVVLPHLPHLLVCAGGGPLL